MKNLLLVLALLVSISSIAFNDGKVVLKKNESINVIDGDTLAYYGEEHLSLFTLDQAFEKESKSKNTHSNKSIQRDYKNILSIDCDICVKGKNSGAVCPGDIVYDKSSKSECMVMGLSIEGAEDRYAVLSCDNSYSPVKTEIDNIKSLEN